MITVTKATSETRSRDRKRRRLILRIGRLTLHVTQSEALSLLKTLRKLTARSPKA